MSFLPSCSYPSFMWPSSQRPENWQDNSTEPTPHLIFGEEKVVEWNVGAVQWLDSAGVTASDLFCLWVMFITPGVDYDGNKRLSVIRNNRRLMFTYTPEGITLLEVAYA